MLKRLFKNMRISRIFVSNLLDLGKSIQLDDDTGHYVKTVLRLKKDSGVILFNGNGIEYAGTVIEASRKNVLIHVHDRFQRSVESPLTIRLGLAITRGDKMDFAIQKSVELGVNSITPIFTERCVVQLTGEKLQHRLSHWQKIVIHATEQCGRSVVPELNPILERDDWLQNQTGLRIFLDPHAETSLSELKPDKLQVTLMSGPEGGFAKHERNAAIGAGYIPVRLGARILRAETAVLAALAAVQTLWGDFNANRL